MNFPAGGPPGPEIVTQESLLLGAAERVGRIRDGRSAVHFRLSRLKLQNRQEGHIRIALRMLEPMVNAYRGQMFLLGDSDIVLMMKDANLADVDAVIFKLRALFSKDPLTFADAGDGRDEFCVTYDLDDDYEDFLAMARAAAHHAKQRQREVPKAAPRPLDAKTLHGVLQTLAVTDVSALIRRQSAVVMTGHGTAEVLFQEFFVGMADLQKTLSPDVNLLSNRWLFQHLSQTLDQRVLAAFEVMALTVPPSALSLNLNVGTVLGPAFEKFAQAEDTGRSIAVELQVLDVLADSRAYYAARQQLRDRGYLVVIDGLNELTVRFMDLLQFSADLYKLSWSPDLKEAEHGDTIMAAVEALGKEKLVLARCDSETAIGWGLDQGIQRFQGRYVDAMLAAYTMHACDRSTACTLPHCIARHAVISGPVRSECGNTAMLDSSPVMKALGARRREAASQ